MAFEGIDGRERGSRPDEVSARRSVQAQSLVREVNEQIHRLVRLRTSETEECGLICECSDSSCLRSSRFPGGSTRTSGASRPASSSPTATSRCDEERVVEQGARYIVVEKVGPGAATALKLDPRRATTR